VTLVLGLSLAGGLGAVTRLVVARAVSQQAGSGSSLGIFVVNVSGTLALGVLIGAGLKGDALVIAATGALGSYTTFSTWMFDSQRLHEGGRRRAAALNLALSLATGIFAVWLGRELGASL